MWRVAYVEVIGCVSLSRISRSVAQGLFGDDDANTTEAVDVMERKRTRRSRCLKGSITRSILNALAANALTGCVRVQQSRVGDWI